MKSGKTPVCKLCIHAKVAEYTEPCSRCGVNKAWMSRYYFAPADETAAVALLRELVEAWNVWARLAPPPEGLDEEHAARHLGDAVTRASEYLNPELGLPPRRHRRRRGRGDVFRYPVDERVRDLRERRQLLRFGQKEAAFAIGVSRQTLSAVERGLRRTSEELIERYTAWIVVEEEKAAR